MRTILLAAVLLSVGCGICGEDEPGCSDEEPRDNNDRELVCPDRYEKFENRCVRRVTVDIDCPYVRCPGADDTSEFDSGSYQSFTCVWHCAFYDGRPDRYVSLTFVARGECWELDSVYQTSGICP